MWCLVVKDSSDRAWYKRDGRSDPHPLLRGHVVDTFECVETSS